MSLIKRVKGDFVVETVDTTDKITLRPGSSSTEGVIIDGNLTVLGTQTSVESTDTNVVDNIITLNSGEVGLGVSAGTSGIEIDRGSSLAAKIYFDESDDTWYVDDGSGVPTAIVTGATSIGSVVDDLTPQLGGDLDVNGFSIVSVSNGDIVLAANGTGTVIITADETFFNSQDLALAIQVSDPGSTGGYNKLYAKAVGAGGTGVYFQSTTDIDEIASRKKAILYGLIF